MDWRLITAILVLVSVFYVSFAVQSDDDFAEFAEFDEEEFDLPANAKAQAKAQSESTQPQTEDQPNMSEDTESATDEFDDDGVVEVEDNFEEFDTEEFEGGDMDTTTKKTKSPEKEELKFAKVPMNLRRNWASYYVELTIMFGMLIYFISFLLGRSKNSTLAHAWYKANRDILESNFSIVGDDGTSPEPTTGVLMKESDHSYVMWCSGRIGVEGMLVQLKMVKRQDLVNVLQRIVKPASDQIIIQITMEKEDMDNYIFCFAQKKLAVKLHKDMNDLALYIEGKKKGEDYGLPSSYQVMSELSEATRAFSSDSKVLAFMQKYDGVLEYMHVSDQYSGEKQVDDNEQKKMPEISKTLIFCFNLGKKGKATSKDLPATAEWTRFALYCADKCRRFKLTREGKMKSDKNRQKVLDSYNKLAHQQRTELAQQRREERLKAETERYMNEDDPVKARKLEEKRQKRDQAKKLQKMKAVKIKSA